MQGSRLVILDDFLGGVVLRPHYTLGMKRRYGQGFLFLSLDAPRMQSLRLRWLLEGSRGEQDLGSNLRYLVFQGEDLIFLSAEERLRADEAQADAFLAEVQRGRTPRSRTFQTPWGEEVYEVVKPVSIGQREPALLRVGLSLEPTRAILSGLKASILLQLFLSMTLALVATLVVFWMQNRHLLRVSEMERKVQVSERLSSLGELAASLAHEIRNPLNAISMGIQRLRRESAGSLSATEARDLWEVISAEIRRLDSLVERFLGLARPERALRSEGDLRQILLDLLQLFSDEFRQKGIELSSSIPPDLPPIPMDAERIKQAFLNLIKNSVEAMERSSAPPPGPRGTLRVEAHPLGRQSIRVTFTDSGCGIPTSEQHRVFDPYYTTKPQGVGLGLSLAYQIIRAHGGQIQIESQEGQGTKVTVTLPTGSPA
jgi:signal transduction histidine kinase